MSRRRFHVLESDEGHDGFLIEQEQVERHLRRFLRKVDKDALDERSISQAATLKLRESVSQTRARSMNQRDRSLH
jgi:hypothetical protein